MRRFEFVDGTSNKFWEAKTEGPKLMVRFGRIGGTWQESDKLLADAEKANAEMEKLIREKTRKGYLEVGGKPEVKVLAKAVAKKEKTKEPKPQSMEATISPAERKAKAQKVLLMFANGQWEMAHNILENSQDEEWLFEQLLNGCKIEDGKPIPSNAIKKAIKEDEKSNPVLAMLNIMLCIPHGSKLLKTFKFEKLTGNIGLGGLESLSDGAAEALSKYSGELWLGLISFSDSPGNVALAGKLASQKENVSLGYLTSLSDGAAKALSKHKGELDLRRLESLPDSPGHIALAGKLASQNEGVELGCLTTLGDVAAKALSKNNGFLNLNRLESLSDAAAEALSESQGKLGLSGLVRLSDGAAKSLGKHKGWLGLCDLTSLSDTAAEALSKHEGDLLLMGLTSISSVAAIALSKHKGELALSGLTSLDDAAAESLSNHEGKLDFNGLTSLSDGAAKALSKHEGELDLRRLECLPDSPGHIALARKLASQKGNLMLSLRSLGDHAAEELSKHDGDLYLSNLTSLSDTAAEALSKHKGGDLDLNGLESLSDAAAKSLSKHKGYLELSGSIKQKVEKYKKQGGKK